MFDILRNDNINVIIHNKTDLINYNNMCYDKERVILTISSEYDEAVLYGDIQAYHVIVCSKSVKTILGSLRCNFLDISSTNIQNMKSLNVEYIRAENIKHDLVLPDNLNIIGLSLDGTDITKLPNNLYIMDYFNIENTPLSTIPDGTFIGNTIYSSDKFSHLSGGYIFCNSLLFEYFGEPISFKR